MSSTTIAMRDVAGYSPVPGLPLSESIISGGPPSRSGTHSKPLRAFDILRTWKAEGIPHCITEPPLHKQYPVTNVFFPNVVNGTFLNAEIFSIMVGDEDAGLLSIEGQDLNLCESPQVSIKLRRNLTQKEKRGEKSWKRIHELENHFASATPRAQHPI